MKGLVPYFCACDYYVQMSKKKKKFAVFMYIEICIVVESEQSSLLLCMELFLYRVASF